MRPWCGRGTRKFPGEPCFVTVLPLGFSEIPPQIPPRPCCYPVKLHRLGSRSNPRGTCIAIGRARAQHALAQRSAAQNQHQSVTIDQRREKSGIEFRCLGGNMFPRIVWMLALVASTSCVSAQTNCSPDGFGGQRCSNSRGITQITPDGFGGSRISGPNGTTNVTPDGFGGSRITSPDGRVTNCKPDGFGGTRCN